MDYDTRALAFWHKYAALIITAGVALLLLVGVMMGQRYIVNRDAEAASKRYEDMHAEVRALEGAEALTLLEDFIVAEPNGYGVLAKYRRAHLLYEEEGDWEEAARLLREIAEDGFLPRPLRDMAQLSVAYVLLGHAPAREVAGLLEVYLEEEHPLHLIAREAMAWALFLEQDYLRARDYLQAVASDDDISESMRTRTEALLSYIQRYLHPDKAEAS